MASWKGSSKCSAAETTVGDGGRHCKETSTLASTNRVFVILAAFEILMVATSSRSSDSGGDPGDRGNPSARSCSPLDLPLVAFRASY